MTAVVSDITTAYGETLPLPEWLNDVEPVYDATLADAEGRAAFVAARKDQHPERFLRPDSVAAQPANVVALTPDQLAAFTAWVAAQTEKAGTETPAENG